MAKARASLAIYYSIGRRWGGGFRMSEPVNSEWGDGEESAKYQTAKLCVPMAVSSLFL